MTVPASPAHVEYLADGSTVAFTYPFKVANGGELEARVAGLVVTETVDYGLSGVGNDGGGTVTFYVAPVSGVVSLRRLIPYEQLLALIPNGALPSTALEYRLDQIVKMIQQLDEELSRRPALPVGVASLLRDLDFPLPGSGKVIGWNDLGTALTLFDTSIFLSHVDTVATVVEGNSPALLATVAGDWTLVASGLVPSGVEVLGVTYYCSTGFGTSNGLTAVNIGGFGIEDGWGANVGITLGTTTTPGNFRRGDHPVSTAATDIVVTAVGGPFDATGACIVTVHWRRLVAKTSI